MSFPVFAKDLLTVVSVLSLLVVGLAISLKSGVVSVGPQNPRLLLGNLSHVIFTLAGYLLVLGMLQQLIGFRLSSIW